MNGSLWSLPYEFACYLGVGGLAVLGVLRRQRFVVAGLFLYIRGLYTFSCLSPQRLPEYFPYSAFSELVMFSYFSAGSACFLYREQIPVLDTVVRRFADHPRRGFDLWPV